MADPDSTMRQTRQGIGRLRQVGLVVSSVVAIAALAVYVFIRTERPLHFTDGSAFVEGIDWRQAPRVVWDRPVPAFEVPGPVRGRILELPSGELIYGRVLADGTSDLVRFDPALPDQQPIPLVALNSRFQDFAPALGPDGALWFSSDRTGGEGGFDLWRAESRGLGRFGRPEPVGAPINDVGDEVDPAFAPDGSRIVFARRTVRERTTLLFTASLDGESPSEPAPLFAFDPEIGEVRLERDPSFSRDGTTLHFSRSTDRSLPVLMRAWRHVDEFSEPTRTQFGSRRSVSMRSPMPRADGSIAVLDTGEAERPMLQIAGQRLVHPWWKGQRDLERLLLVIFGVALLTFVLLLLGARWKRLDIVTWCLLLSLLVHLLLWLYMEGVRILDDDPRNPVGDDEWSMEVAVFDGAAEGVASDGPEGPSDSARNVAVERRSRLEGFETDSPAVGELQSVEARERARESLEFDAAVPLRTEGSVAPERPAAELSEPTVRAEVQSDAELGDGTEGLETGDVTPTRVAQAEASRPAESASALRVAGPSTSELVRVRSEPRRSVSTFDPSTLRPSSAGPVAARVEAVSTPLLDAPSVQGALVADAEVDSRSLEGLADVGPAEVAPGLEPDAPAPRAIAIPGTEQRPAPGTGLRRPSASRPRPSRAPETMLPTAGRVASLDSSTPRLAEPRSPVSIAEASARPESSVHEASVEPSIGSRSLDDLLAQAELEPVGEPSDPTLDRSAGRPDPNETSRIDPVAEIARSSLRRPSSRSARRSTERREAADGRPSSSLERRPRDQRMAELGAPELRTPDALSDLARSETRPDREATDPSTRLTDPADSIARALNRTTEASALPEATRPVRRAERRTRGQAGEEAELGALDAPRSRIARLGRSEVERSGAAEAIASLYSNRFGPRKDEALRRFGGSAETEKAVRDGLRYLASLQRRNGFWGNDHRDRKYGDTEIGRSALCVLAFLGAGHTQMSGTEHSAVVASALEALLRVQDDETGHFGRRTSSYSHGISTYALAECYAITHDERLRVPLERAVARIVSEQDLSRDPRNHGGWGYFSPTLEPEDGYARSSVSAWMVMALESAKIGGVEVPDDTLAWARRFLQSMYDGRNGYFLYSREPSRLRSTWRTLPASSPAAAFCLLLLGEDPASNAIEAAMEYTARRRPRRYAQADDNDFVLRADGNPYFWYYGTLASFMRGGEDWEQWNGALKEVLLSGQEEDGSFPPIGAYASYAGDTRRNAAFTTALCVLSLEVYYRYFTPLLSGR